MLKHLNDLEQKLQCTGKSKIQNLDLLTTAFEIRGGLYQAGRHLGSNLMIKRDKNGIYNDKKSNKSHVSKLPSDLPRPEN